MVSKRAWARAPKLPAATVLMSMLLACGGGSDTSHVGNDSGMGEGLGGPTEGSADGAVDASGDREGGQPTDGGATDSSPAEGADGGDVETPSSDGGRVDAGAPDGGNIDGGGADGGDAALPHAKNTQPTAHPQTLDGCGAISFGLTGEDAETPGHELSISITALPAEGTITAGRPGEWIYTPNDNAVTADSLQFTVWDGDLTSDPATVTFDLRPALDEASATGFVKLDSAGCPLAEQGLAYSWGAGEASGQEWRCVADAETGLIWEVKSPAGAATLQDTDSAFTWYNDDYGTNGGYIGYLGSDSCHLEGGCNTQHYIDAVNEARMCDLTNWRLPTVAELQGIVDFARVGPAINTDYFPNTLTGVPGADARYWTATSVAPTANIYSAHAWHVDAYHGTVQGEYVDDAKNSSFRVRLVSDGE